MVAGELTYPRVRKWSRDEYHRAGELGVFGPDERLELIEGEVFEKMSPQSNPHAAGVTFVAEALRQIAGRQHFVREEKPIVLSDQSEPEPDVVLVRGAPRSVTHHPRPENIALVVEVAETSLQQDRTRKLAVYAKHGITEYWIVNLRQRQLEIHRDPGPLGDGTFGYRLTAVVLEDAVATTLELPDQPILVRDMLPSDLSWTAAPDESQESPVGQQASP